MAYPCLLALSYEAAQRVLLEDISNVFESYLAAPPKLIEGGYVEAVMKASVAEADTVSLRWNSQRLLKAFANFQLSLGRPVGFSEEITVGKRYCVFVCVTTLNDETHMVGCVWELSCSGFWSETPTLRLVGPGDSETHPYIIFLEMFRQAIENPDGVSDDSPVFSAFSVEAVTHFGGPLAEEETGPEPPPVDLAELESIPCASPEPNIDRTKEKKSSEKKATRAANKALKSAGASAHALGLAMAAKAESAAAAKAFKLKNKLAKAAKAAAKVAAAAAAAAEAAKAEK